MNVHQTGSMTVMKMPDALIPLEVTTALVTVAMREMDSAAQVRVTWNMYSAFNINTMANY